MISQSRGLKALDNDCIFLQYVFCKVYLSLSAVYDFEITLQEMYMEMQR